MIDQSETPYSVEYTIRGMLLLFSVSDWHTNLVPFLNQKDAFFFTGRSARRNCTLQHKLRNCSHHFILRITLRVVAGILLHKLWVTVFRLLENVSTGNECAYENKYKLYSFSKCLFVYLVKRIIRIPVCRKY